MASRELHASANSSCPNASRSYCYRCYRSRLALKFLKPIKAECISTCIRIEGSSYKKTKIPANFEWPAWSVEPDRN